MPVLTKHRFNASEYYRMAETGVIRPDARVELLDGEIIDMSPIGPFHGGIVNRLNAWFVERSKSRYIVSVQNPLLIDQFSEPQPDLMLLRPAADDYTSRHATPKDVLLLVEVADTSLPYDRGEKLRTYARAGVPEVCIVNLEERLIEAYREPQLHKYQREDRFTAGDKIHPLAFPDLDLDTAQLLRAG